MGKTSIRNNIRRLRFEAKEMTQAELAEKVGVTRQTLNAIEAAKYSPTLELAFRIAKVFGVPWMKCSNMVVKPKGPKQNPIIYELPLPQRYAPPPLLS